MNRLIQQIEQWAEDRNLIKGSTPQKQMLKLMEEFGELCGGIAKNKPEVIKDSIGDCFVVLVILENQLYKLGLTSGIDCANWESVIKEYDDHILYELRNKNLDNTLEIIKDVHMFIQTSGRITKSFYNGYKLTRDLRLLVGNLYMISYWSEQPFEESIQHAYDQIKDRNGKMIDGVFVKEEDL
ncbi:MAG: MazG-like family protein [[Actinobacillus] rossii]|uniref:NTP pyrophosphohydrolase MazG-like domain-containing protein n=1 Tax=[Actinobacillus] rossii TaxID=123820 RepID=A0A380U0H4_9PAST|nr:MazG-like family protein [[Actinobacillus] rossii]MDY4506105.1 MazG-like family protein [[Actinobacillus] rossii]SUT93560.1 Uncharacterised protein [[Actinobacillus] rossii]SUT93799.1 Uncharacterised protein [[Actinobacillus] rossii]